VRPLPIPIRVCRDQPARCHGGPVADRAGLATHAGPEAGAGAGHGVSDALTGGCAGRGWRPALGPVPGADARRTRGRPPRQPRFGEGQAGPAGSETSRRPSHTVRGAREALPLAWARQPGPHGNPARGTAVMPGGGASGRPRRPRRPPHVGVESRPTRRRVWREGRWPRGRTRRLSITHPGCPATAACARSFTTACGAPGVRRWVVEARGPASPGRGSPPSRRRGVPHPRSCSRLLHPAGTSPPAAKARCGHAARRELCGGRQVTGVPTATALPPSCSQYGSVVYWQHADYRPQNAPSFLGTASGCAASLTGLVS
jgi:hypothetical protein